MSRMNPVYCSSGRLGIRVGALICILVVFCLSATDLNAQAFTKMARPQPSETVAVTHGEGLPPGSFTQSVDPSTVVADTSVACGGSVHADNSYLRRFDLDGDHAFSGEVTVGSVSVGVEIADSGAGTGQPVTVNLWAVEEGDPFVYENLMLIGTTTIADFPDQELTLPEVQVVGTIPDATMYDLVVEVFTPFVPDSNHSFFIGANSAGEIASSYVRAPSCGAVEPTPFSSLGFPEVHVVMQVHLGEGMGCVAIPDGDYDGTRESMACLSTPGPSTTIGDLNVEMVAAHTWVGDLVIKLYNPSMEVLTLMSRPGLDEPADDGSGCCGELSDLEATWSVVFDDSASTSAEAMGDNVFVVCRDDGICEFSPDPGAGPGTNLGQFNGQDGTGEWMLCVGDSAGGDTGAVCHFDMTDIDSSIFSDGFESGDTSAWQGGGRPGL